MTGEPICRHCGLPIVPGQARYTAGEGADPPRFAHWECHQRSLDELEAAFRRVPELTARARSLIDKLRGN